jgi:hypothetical protein
LLPKCLTFKNTARKFCHETKLREISIIVSAASMATGKASTFDRGSFIKIEAKIYTA